MSIILKSEILTITKIKKKTSAKLLKELIVGDKIQLSVDARPVGGNRGTYATYIKIEDIKNGECTYMSFNQLSPLYNSFELEVAESVNEYKLFQSDNDFE